MSNGASEQPKKEPNGSAGRAGQAVTFQSLLQYVLMALVGLLAYFQNEASKSAAWAREEVVEARKEAVADRDKAATERQATWTLVNANTLAMDNVLRELSAARKEQKSLRAEVAKAQATGEATQKTVVDVKKAVDKIE